MPSKMQFYAQMADQAAKQITGSYQSWISFLQTAGRLYKYPYNEQVMIHAQRPDATACAEYDFWNRQWGRYVRRGSKGIALIDTSIENPRLRYVFDVADTGTRENSRAVRLWELHEEHSDVIRDMLERSYGISGEYGMRDQLKGVAEQLADEYWNEHRRDILDNLADSFLEGYDEADIGVRFRNAATASIAYALMSRCGLEPDEWFEHEDFLNVFDFNTPAAVSALGTAVSESNQQVLRQIEITIRYYEREHSAERMAQHGNDVHEERGLSDPRPGSEGNEAETPGQVRAAEEDLFEGASADPVEQDDPGRDSVLASSGDRRDGEPEAGTDDTGADEIGGRDGEPKSQRSDEVGADDEQPKNPSRGSDPERADLQLNIEQLSLFPTEEEQISLIDEGMSAYTAPIPFSMPISQETIDHILRLSGNQDNGRMNIVNEFSKGKSLEEIADYLKNTFRGGNGIIIDGARYSAWYAEDGIHIANGTASQYVSSARIISWKDAAERIEKMLDEGTYATNVEIQEAPRHEREVLAQALWYLHHDLSEEAHSQGYLSLLENKEFAGFPNETEALTERLSDPAFQRELTDQFSAFWTAQTQDRSLLRFNYHRLDQIHSSLQDLSLERRTFPAQMSEIPRFMEFITDDEVFFALAGSGNVEGSKSRIYAYFMESHTVKERADFLKAEYGIGGRSHALSGASHSSEDYDSKGIRLRKRNCIDVEMRWNEVAWKIDELIKKERFFTPQEMDLYNRMHEEPQLIPKEKISIKDILANRATGIMVSPPGYAVVKQTV